MAGQRDPKDTPAGMPRDKPTPKARAEAVFTYAGDDENTPCNVVLIGKPTKKGTIRVRRLDLDMVFSANMDRLTAPEGHKLPA